jgi:hypothetical protein
VPLGSSHRAAWRAYVVAGARSDLEYPLPRLGGEHLTQPGAGYERVREVEREAQAVWAGRGVLALPPEICKEACSPH